MRVTWHWRSQGSCGSSSSFSSLFSCCYSFAALAGVTMGTTTSAVAYMVSVKSLIANLLMRLSC